MTRWIVIMGLAMMAVSLTPRLSLHTDTQRDAARRAAFEREQGSAEAQARAVVKQDAMEQTERAMAAQTELEAAEKALLVAQKREQAALSKLVPDAFELTKVPLHHVSKHAPNHALKQELEAAHLEVLRALGEQKRATQSLRSARPAVVRELEVTFANPHKLELEEPTELWLELKPATSSTPPAHRIKLTSLDAKVQVNLVGWPGDLTIRETSFARRKVGDSANMWRWVVQPKSYGSKTFSYRISSFGKDERITSDETHTLQVAVPVPSFKTNAWRTVSRVGSEPFYVFWAGLATLLFGLVRARLRSLARRASSAVHEERHAKRTVVHGPVQVALQGDTEVSAELCDVSDDASGLAVLFERGVTSPEVGATVRVEHFDGKPPQLGLVKNVTVSHGRARVGLAVIAAAAALALMIADSKAYGQTQGLLGPGLYVFQTRTRGSTCNDSEKDGYVMTFLAAIDGIPGSTSMAMQLINNQHFTKWSLTVEDGGKLEGSSKMGSSPTAPETHFAATLDGERWKGTGARTYNSTIDGKPMRCRVDYDALLKRVDVKL